MRQVRGRESRPERSVGRRATPARGTGTRTRKTAIAAGDGPRAHGMLRRFFSRPILVLTLFLVVIGGGIGLFAGGHVARGIDGVGAAIQAPFTEAGFAVRDITLTGQERTTDSAAFTALGIEQGRSIFSVRPDEARARLKMLPWVAEAEVRRHFPGTIAIRLIEKRPFAIWRNGTKLTVVERSGAVITNADAQQLGRLPVIVGPGAPEAAAPIVDAIVGETAVSARVQAIARIGERRWDLVLSGGVTVRLPEEGWERELSELERLIVERGVLERDIEMIDLRFPDNYVFRLRNGDSRPVPRERQA